MALTLILYIVCVQKKFTPKWLPIKKLASDYASEISYGTAPQVFDRFINRDISWLTFNDRVLAEAERSDVPLLERLFFVGIVSYNLDEFFSVRVAELLRLSKISPKKRYPDALTPQSLALQVRERVLRQKSRQAEILNDLLKMLSEQNIVIYTNFANDDPSLDSEIESHLPEMEIFFSKLSDPMPLIQGTELYVFIRFSDGYAIIGFKKPQERLLELSAKGKTRRFVLVERWLMARAQKLFKNRKVLENFSFRLLRNADIPISLDEDETIESQVIKGVKKRPYSRIVRLEIDSSGYPDSTFFLATNFHLDPASIYRFDLPLKLHFFTSFKTMFAEAAPHLLYPDITPLKPRILKKCRDIFEAISRQDIILHHPYDSFDVVMDFLGQAARDPNVTEIFHTLYRTGTAAQIVRILKTAANNGKKVTVYVEIMARFDEMNNVMHADDLRKAGVKVVNPIGAYKVHSKITLVHRMENGARVCYAHMGTGNYHAQTARQYTDLGLLTKNTDITTEATGYCKMIQTQRPYPKFRHLLVSPVNLHKSIRSLIENEIAYSKKGFQGRIIAKMNALTDTSIIEKLYAASNAGVQVDLIVRGTCCLKPGVPGLSENIRVVSIIDRFLEHSRIFYFRANGEHKLFLSSADWRPRNFLRRYEIAFPVTDSAIKEYLRDVVLHNSVHDTARGCNLRADGSYAPAQHKTDSIRSQFLFEQLAKNEYRDTPLSNRNLPKYKERHKPI